VAAPSLTVMPIRTSLAPGPTIALIQPRPLRVRNLRPQRLTSAVRRCGHGDFDQYFVLPIAVPVWTMTD